MKGQAVQEVPPCTALLRVSHIFFAFAFFLYFFTTLCIAIAKPPPQQVAPGWFSSSVCAITVLAKYVSLHDAARTMFGVTCSALTQQEAWQERGGGGSAFPADYCQ